MALKYLVDSNIFLEILLAQAKAVPCKSFLQGKHGEACISDFSLHSIGVIAFLENKISLFNTFLQDLLPHLAIITLSPQGYMTLAVVREKYQLDFDDTYQCCVAAENNLTIATMDQHYVKVREHQPILFV